MRLAELLDNNGVLYESEKIFLNGDRHPGRFLHSLRHARDRGRWIGA
jgi:hypothetical protein